MNTMKGRRCYPNADGRLHRMEINQPGAYGKPDPTKLARRITNIAPRMLWWEVTCPDGSTCILNPDVHSVTEMGNGTITVHPSIQTHSWHGWLEGGVWRPVIEGERSGWM